MQRIRAVLELSAWHSETTDHATFQHFLLLAVIRCSALAVSALIDCYSQLLAFWIRRGTLARWHPANARDKSAEVQCLRRDYVGSSALFALSEAVRGGASCSTSISAMYGPLRVDKPTIHVPPRGYLARLPRKP